jgi:hypothetical protein
MQSARSWRVACHTLGYSAAIMVGLGVMRVAHAYDSRGAAEELTTADTAIAVEAGENAPRLTTLRGAMVWKNRTEEALPDHVEVRAAAQPLVWRLDRAASRFDSKQIQLVYATGDTRPGVTGRTPGTM